VTWCIILLEIAIREWVHGGHKGMGMVRNNAQVGRLNDAQLALRGLKCAKKTSPTPLHHHHQQQGMMDPFSHSVYTKI